MIRLLVDGTYLKEFFFFFFYVGYDSVGVCVYDGSSAYDVVGVCGFFLYFIHLQKFRIS